MTGSHNRPVQVLSITWYIKLATLPLAQLSVIDRRANSKQIVATCTTRSQYTPVAGSDVLSFEVLFFDASRHQGELSLDVLAVRFCFLQL